MLVRRGFPRVAVAGIVTGLAIACLAPVSEAAGSQVSSPKVSASAAQLQAARARASRLSSFTPAYCDKKSLASWQKRVGIAPAVLSVYLDSSSWARIADPTDHLACWSLSPGTRFSFSVPLLPRDGSGTLVKGASGAYDDYFRQLATKLVAEKAGNAYLRVGWEFNGSWQPWRAGANRAAYIAYYRRVVNVMRSVPGAKFSFVWSLTTGPTETDARSVYPGDRWVDVIGLDTYDAAFTSGTYPLPKGASVAQIAVRRAAAWREIQSGFLGLDTWWKFARAHKKQLAVTEWGLVGNAGKGSEPHGGGDNADYIRNMNAWMKARSVTYAAYFNAPANLQSVLGRDQRGKIPFPKGTAAFTSVFQAPKSLPKK